MTMSVLLHLQRGAKAVSAARFAARTLATAPSPLERAHALAVGLLDAERDKTRAHIADLENKCSKASGDPVQLSALKRQLREKKIELGFTIRDYHRKFDSGEIDYSDPVFMAMDERRRKTAIIPKVVKMADQWSIRQDALPADLAPSVGLQVAFGDRKFLAPIGQHIQPHWAIHSPEIVITTGVHAEETEYFTLMMTNLDRANLDTGSYEEWCHWLVTDIPVKGRLVLPSGPSPYFKPDRLTNTIPPESPYASLPPSPEPWTPETFPGKVVLDYVPPHPNFSNPRKPQRYLFTLMRQSTPSVDIDMAKIQSRVEVSDKDNVAATPTSTTQQDKLMSERNYEGEGEREMAFRTRFEIAPTMRFARAHQLTPVGYGFVTSSWNVEASHMFTALGLHEPVLGKKYRSDVTRLATRLDAARDTAAMEMTQAMEQETTQSVDHGSVTSPSSAVSLSRDALMRIGKGRRPSFDPARVISTGSVYLEAIRKEDERRAAAASSVSSSTTATSAQPLQSASPRRMRVTELAAAAIVRNKPSDIASSVMGDVTASIKNRRGRYHNV